MSCDGCALLLTGCDGLRDRPCDKLGRKLRAAEKAKQMSKQICTNCIFWKQEWADIGFCHVNKIEPRATKGEFECWCGGFKPSLPESEAQDEEGRAEK